MISKRKDLSIEDIEQLKLLFSNLDMYTQNKDDKFYNTINTIHYIIRTHNLDKIYDNEPELLENVMLFIDKFIYPYL